MIRIGHGYDVHRYKENRKLILGGVEIPFELGLDGHSDADVLTHAIIDAILGALSMGDIGKLFPDTDDEYKDINSIFLLREVMNILEEKKYKIVNLDATIVAQKPKLRPFIQDIEKNLCKELSLGEDSINIKATTEEELGFTGEMLGVKAYCVLIIEN